MGELIYKSFAFDLRLLLLRSLPLRYRLAFVVQKWIALATIVVLRRPARIRVASLDFEVADVSGLGTLQSNIVDFDQEVVRPKILPPRPVVIDAGANIGQFCFAVKLFYPGATVYSFEPDPETQATLVRNTSNMSDVTTYAKGLSNRAERIPFHRAPLSTMSSFATTEETTSMIELEVDRLDAILGSLPKVDLLKIDVEGLEYEVLEGSEGLLGKVDFLLVEVSLGREQQSHTNVELFDLLSSRVQQARLLKTGRPLGHDDLPTCQNFIFDLRSKTDVSRPQVEN